MKALNLFVLSIILISSGVYAIDTESTYSDPAEAAIRLFYSSLPNNCPQAIKIRPKYTPAQCNSTRWAKVEVIKLIVQRDKFKQFEVSVNISKDEYQKPKKENGCVSMTEKPEGWIFDKWESKTCENISLEQETAEALTTIPSDAHEDNQPVKGNTYGKKPPEDNSAPSSEDVIANSQYANANALLQKCWLQNPIRQEIAGDRIRKLSVPEPGTMPAALVKKVQQYNQKPAIYGSIRSVKLPHGNKSIALTFDLCEQANEESGYDGPVINYLRDHNIRATFYAGGKWMQTHPERTKQLMLDPRFEIGNHSWTHGNLRVMTGQRMQNQILWTQAQYYHIRKQLEEMDCVPNSAKQRIPWIPATFRYPYGTCSAESMNTIQELGLPGIQWSVVTGDPGRSQTAQGIANIVLKNTRPGDIIIAHANRRGYNTAKALPLFIPQLQARGYKFVTVSELLAMGEPIAADTCYELRVGDNVRYDRLFGEGTGEKNAPTSSAVSKRPKTATTHETQISRPDPTKKSFSQSPRPVIRVEPPQEQLDDSGENLQQAPSNKSLGCIGLGTTCIPIPYTR